MGDLLPKDDHLYQTHRCCYCGRPCAENYEHCDRCLVAAVRGMTAVSRAVHGYKARKFRYRENCP